MPASLLPCPWRARCGGCPELPTPIDAQRAARQAWLERVVGRPLDAFVPSPRSEGYRARVTLNVGPGGALGYHAHRSHELVAIDACAVARPELNEALRALSGGVGGALSRVELRSDGARVVIDAHSEEKTTGAARAAAKAIPWDHVSLNGERVKGDPTLQLTVAGIEHRVSPGAFYQVNLEVNEALVQRVVGAVTELKPSAVLDLYSGMGNLSMPLARAGVRVTMLESSPASVRDARATAERLGLQVDIQRKNVGELQPGDHFFDLALLDPPRAGAPGIMERLVVTRPRALVYVSCNPMTLTRDLKPALKAGYALTQLVGFEMFPHTPHVEAMAVLTRG